MGKISSVVGKMPFAGKSFVENTALSAITERTSTEEKTFKSTKAILILGAFVLGHGIQAKMGVYDVFADYHDLTTNGATSGEVFEMGLSSFYTVANAAVTYTQAEIACRVGRNYYRFMQNIRAGGELADEDFAYTPRKATLLQTAFTLAGQLTFLHFLDK